MAKKQSSKKRKGTFSGIRLPVAKHYLYPLSRNRTLLTALGIAGLVLGILLTNMLFDSGNIVSNGPLSSNHSNFENDCTKCHSKFSLSNGIMAAVQDNKCLACHQNVTGNVKSFVFASHYVYRSFDKRRATVKDSILVQETACLSCHPEHSGRDSEIINAADTKCLACHQYDSFNQGHPQFQFAREELADRANLKFTHIFHVKELQRRGKVGSLEEACFTCHQPQADGKRFQPIRFEGICSDCHLGITNPTPTAELAIKKTARSSSPGVKPIRAIEASNRPGSSWVKFANPNEFDEFTGTVVKQVLHHKDPWILKNLRLLREEMFPDAGLADLLKSDGEIPRQQSTLLYQEAVATLETQVRELQSHPSPVVQEDLERITEELNRIKKLLRNPGDAQFDYRKFDLGGAEMAVSFRENPEKLARYTAFVNELTAECQTCHIVENATILRVQKDQRVLLRAGFNHQAHVVQNGCLDCHQNIAFEKFADQTEIPAEADNAAIQNIPIIETCQSCHTAEAASNRCITCHQFHPGKSHLISRQWVSKQ